MTSTATSANAVPHCFALLGNPNTGKTTLFNRLCGMRAKTANFSGSTVEARIGSAKIGGRDVRIVDLPGVYGLNLDRPESRVCKEYLGGAHTLGVAPEAAIVIADATNLARNLIFVCQALQRGLPTVVALTMTDIARSRGITIDIERLATRLGCPVVSVSPRSGEGLDTLMSAMCAPRCVEVALADPTDARSAWHWAEDVAAECSSGEGELGAGDRFTERLDTIATHPILGLVLFAAVMTGLFYMIFTLATVPMDLIELLFAKLGALVSSIVPAGAIRDLLVDGVVSGIAGTLVFLPQICLLFFLISLLEDTGYLARAVFVTDRWLRPLGLPGHAFVPLLSAHACAIPAIMSTRLLTERRDRIATILTIPFMSCSARLPVYVLLVGILFRDPLLAGLAFLGCYALGAGAGLLTALVARRTILPGRAVGMVLELPSYRAPSLRTALTTTIERAWMFLRKAGTVIVAICIVLWWLSAYPKVPEPPAAADLRQEASIVALHDPALAESLATTADTIAARHAVSSSFAGRIGRALTPVFEPLGLDWQLTIGVVTSFAAREVFVSTLAVIFAGTDDAENATVLAQIQTAERDDGRAVFTRPVAASLLVFYVLAMQCLPTLPVTAREAGHWKWALLQFVYMTTVAYVCAFLAYRLCLALFAPAGA